MIEKIVCWLTGHKWHFYPESATFHDYKVCDRCDKSIALSPYLTRGEVEYLENMLIGSIRPSLVAWSSEFKLKGENDE